MDGRAGTMARGLGWPNDASGKVEEIKCGKNAKKRGAGGKGFEPEPTACHREGDMNKQSCGDTERGHDCGSASFCESDSGQQQHIRPWAKLCDGHDASKGPSSGIHEPGAADFAARM